MVSQRLLRRQRKPRSERRIAQLVAFQIRPSRQRKFLKKIIQRRNLIGRDAVLFHALAIERRILPGVLKRRAKPSQLQPV
jgi:hypothetical protein